MVRASFTSTMKLRTTLPLAIWLTLLLAVRSKDVRHRDALEVHGAEEKMSEQRAPEEEMSVKKVYKDEMLLERDLVPRKQLDDHLEAQDDNGGDKSGLGLAAFEGVATLIQIDYTQPAGQIAKEVADTVVPIIATALAFIPGVGPLISGVFSSLWGIFSPMLSPQKEKQENPMEKMVKEMATQLRKEMDATLSNIINKAIHGELARNTYICNKYDYMAQTFAENFNKSIALPPLDAVKLTIYLDGCDNFLKDTAEAFVYDKYADILWVPSAMTTSVRLGFLAEIIKNGPLIGFTRNVTVTYLKELKIELERVFKFYNKGLQTMHSRVAYKYRYETLYYMLTDQNNNYLKDVNAVEQAACTLQGQFFYFDRQIYPYGMPTVLNNTDNFANISMADHYTEEERQNKTNKHLQIFFNVTDSNYPAPLISGKESYFKDFYNNIRYGTMTIMNCLLGPTNLRLPNIYWFNFYPMPEKNRYSYEFRVMYFDADEIMSDYYKYMNSYDQTVPVLSNLETNGNRADEYKEIHKKINKNEGIDSRTKLIIEFVKNSSTKAQESKKVIDVPGWVRWKNCPVKDDPYYFYCKSFGEMFHGKFRMYSAGTFNHNNEDVNPLILIQDPVTYYESYQDTNKRRNENRVPLISSGFLLGVEIILRQVIN